MDSYQDECVENVCKTRIHHETANVDSYQGEAWKTCAKRAFIRAFTKRQTGIRTKVNAWKTCAKRAFIKVIHETANVNPYQGECVENKR